MAELVKKTINCLLNESDVAKIQDNIIIAGDLLARSVSVHNNSGFPQIDAEIVTKEEGEQIKQALLDVLSRHSNTEITNGVIWALRKGYDPSYKDLYLKHLKESLEMLMVYNSIMCQSLLALGDIDPDVFEWDLDGTTTQGMMDVDKNIRQARKYLRKHNIVVPW